MHIKTSNFKLVTPAFFGCLCRRGNSDCGCARAETVGEAGFPCVTARVPLNFTRTYANWKKYEQRIASAMDKWQPPIGVFARV